MYMFLIQVTMKKISLIIIGIIFLSLLVPTALCKIGIDGDDLLPVGGVIVETDFTPLFLVIGMTVLISLTCVVAARRLKKP